MDGYGGTGVTEESVLTEKRIDLLSTYSVYKHPI